MENWRTAFHQYLKHSNQYDCIFVGYPILRTFMAEGFKDLDELQTSRPFKFDQTNPSTESQDDSEEEKTIYSESGTSSAPVDKASAADQHLRYLNSYLESDNGENFYVFTTFAKPGCHSIIIYDPEKKEFYKKVQIINYRNDHAVPYTFKRLDVISDPNSIKSPSVRRQNELLRKKSPLLEQDKELDYFSIKPTISSRESVIANYQQQEHCD